MNSKLFVSYHHDSKEDHYKSLLNAWSENGNDFFKDIKFEDLSIGVSINSKNSNYIKQRIKEEINYCDTFLCLIGTDTHKSDWVNWEIYQAYELNKKIIAVKIENSNISPSNIFGKGAKWARSFNAEAIMDALR